MSGMRWGVDRECGQAALLMVAALLLISLGTVAFGAIASGIGQGGRNQSAADLAALAGGRSMESNFDQLFVQTDAPGAAGISRATYIARARVAALKVAAENGVTNKFVQITFPNGEELAPTQIKVVIARPYLLKFRGEKSSIAAPESATAELSPVQAAFPDVGSGDEYKGPFAYRQGKPMRPDVAMAFDHMYGAARADGVTISVNSAFRSNAEQAILFAAHPDPKWVARPGTSLHRMGTELDLGPPGSMPWVSAHAKQFHFVQRYSWEPWHFGYNLNAGSSGAIHVASSSAVGKGSGDHGVLQSFVPARYASIITEASQRWNFSAAIIAAQLYAESGFNEHAVSSAGAEGIAQFMPGTAAGYGIDPFDPKQAINAEAHMMRDLLRQFGDIRLALAAYNAGSAPVARCHCVPPYPETQAYVVKILGLLKGAGEVGLTGSSVATVRLIK